MGRHGLYSGHSSGVFLAPKNAQNAEIKRQSGAVPILLLTLLALTTSTYSSLGFLQGLNSRRQLLQASVYHSTTSAGVVSMRKMEQRKPISTLPRKVKKTVLWNCLLRSWVRNWTSLIRQSRNRVPSPRNAIGMIATPTPNRVLGWVA